jgi:pyruvate/2-oxoglutarate dehydrogenase complex dihydrolipoamide acyltransferase (E2) component
MVIATPAAMRLAADRGIDLTAIEGTGADGRVTAKDVRDAVALAVDLTVLDAVKGDIAGIARLDPKLARSGLAASALALARELDDPDNSATSKSMCAKSLIDALERLRELAPDEEGNDALDELASRRAARLAGGTRAKN